MDIWKILGIQATKDKDALKKAYRTKLSVTNPEDDPDGFMELRQAYEEAVRLADTEEEESQDDSAMGQLTRIIEEHYRDFDKRISEEAWEELLNRDEFVSLDTSCEAFYTLLRFLMSNFYLPQKIWRFIVDYFDIAARKKELSEIFPGDFIEYILNNSEYEDMINYELFEGNQEEYDTYIENYYHLDAAIRRREFDEQDRYLSALEELDVYHPYLELCKMRGDVQRMNVETEKRREQAGEGADEPQTEITTASLFGDRLEEIQRQAEDVLQDIPEDIFAINTCGDIAMIREKFDEAQKYYDRSYELAPDNYVVKGKQAELLFCLGDYAKSRDMYMDLLKINHFDNNVRAGMIRANQELIRELKKKVEEDPQDDASRLEMAWSYYQSYQFPEAIDILDTFEPTEEKLCEYNNVKGRTYLCLADYDKALVCFERWKAAIEAIPEDALDKDSMDKKKRYEYVNFLIGDCYLKEKQYDKARQYLEVAMAKEHEEIILSYEARCELEYETENYEKCIQACEELLERDERSYIGYNYQSKSCYKLDYLKEALVACEHAINLYPYVSDPYGLEVKIYLKVRQPEAAQGIIDRYREFGIDSDNIDFCEACVMEEEDKHQEIVDLLSAVAKRYNPEETDLDDFSELCMMLGFHLEKLDRNQEAKQCYEKVIELDPEHDAVYGRLGIIYRDEGKYDEALKMYSRQLEIKPHAFYYIHRGLLNRFLLNYKSALDDFEEALKLEPDNAFCYSRIGMIYEIHRDFERALQYFDKAIEIYRENDRDELPTCYSCKARILQCMNRFEESRGVYEKYFAEFGLNADVAYDYSELLQRMNRIDEAAELLRRCIDELPYDDDIQACMRQLCAIYGDEGYVDRANEAMMLAVGHDASDARAYAIMGEVFFHQGLLEDARRMYEKAVQLDSSNKENYYSELIEVLLRKKGLFRPDVREYAARAEIPPEKMRTPVDYIKMARLRRLMKKPKEAMKIIERCLKIKRCSGCFYSACHEAIYERGLIYESMRKYEMARACYREALKICGHNALYEESLKRIEDK